MFEKNPDHERYIREQYSLEEQLYTHYAKMREAMSNIENIKYYKEDTFSKSEDFKQGFIAGVKIMSSILLDL